MKIKKIPPQKLKIKGKKEKKAPINEGLALSFGTFKEGDEKPCLFNRVLYWAVETLLLVSCVGIVVSCLKLPVYPVVILLWAALTTVLCVFLWEKPRFRLWLLGGTLLFTAAAALFGGSLFADGFAVFLNALKDVFGMNLSRVFLPAAVSGQNGAALCVTVFLSVPILIGAVVISYIAAAKGRIVALILLISLFLILILPGKAPAWFWYALLFVGFALLFLLRGTRGERKALPLIALIIACTALTAAALPALGILPGGGKQPAAFSKAEQGFDDLAEFIRWGRDKTNNLPEGDLNGIAPLKQRETPALDLTMSKWETLYLRGYVGTTYTQAGWQPLAKEKLYEYKDLFYSLHSEGFYGTAQIAAAADAAGRDEEKIDVTLKTRGAKKKYVYTPYEYTDAEVGEAASRLGDFAPDRRDFEREISYTVYPNQVRGAVKLASELDAAAKRGNKEAVDYLNRENSCRRFVYETALAVPESEKTVLRSHFGEVDLSEGHLDYDVAMQNILDELWASVEYSEDVSYPAGSDFLRGFLEDYAAGYDVHYAAAATLAFRWYGIPARYVEGYIVTPQDLFGVTDGETITLTGKNSHAWVEYYRDGVGWIPFEVTPPYVFIMKQPDQVSIPQSDRMDSQSEQEGMVEMEADNYENIEEEEPPLEKEEHLSPWLIAAIVCGLPVLALLIAFIVLALRRRAKLIARKLKVKKADERESVDLLFRDILSILFASGLKQRNGSLEGYVAPLKAESGGSDVGALLNMAIGLHREARFSDHPVSFRRRNVFTLLRREVVVYAKSKGSFGKRFVDRYIKCIY